MLALYVATSNRGKLRDFADAAAAWPEVALAPLPGLAGIAAPPEDEATFEGNARTKAAFYATYLPGEIVIADDSGLEVDALAGAPGVKSARYADDCGWADIGSVDDRNNACLLAALEVRHPVERRGRYRCALAAARDGEIVAVAEGALEGDILAEPRGSGGFGYDPLFLVTEYEETMAELDREARLRCSHRGAALRNLLALLYGQSSA